MGLFDKVFKSQRDTYKEEITEVPWHPLTDQSQIEVIKEESKERTVVVFKHSTRCGISRMVLNTFEKEVDVKTGGEFKLYFLDLIANRGVSNEIADHFDVRHESPQMLIIKEEKVVHHASHHSISATDIEGYL